MAFALGLTAGLAFGIVMATAALVGVWAERKVSGRIQMRYGPQEAGPFGLLQTLADTLKLMLKEDITPDQSDVPIFRASPFLVFVPVAASLAVVPLAAGWAPFNMAAGTVFFLAVPAISAVGILMAGWSSRNSYATVGGLRGATQMISYELPRTIVVLALCVLAGSVSTVGVHDAWRWWWIPLNAAGFVVYFIASVAELNRGPFDLAEAESELVAGYFADYSGIRWSIFMMAEYGGLVAASLFGAALFFGGGLGLPGVLGGIVFALVASVIALAMLWVKWSFPRVRPDQLMSVAWKVLTPVALVQLLVVGLVVPWV